MFLQWLVHDGPEAVMPTSEAAKTKFGHIL
jgi:hypothetical protein